MNKADLNYFVDFLLFISFLVTAVTGLVLFLFFEEGVQRGGYQEFLGLIKHDWTMVHNWAGIAMVILAAVHLVLHWGWIVSMTKSVIKGKG